jgi:hypothetical protein
MWTAEGWYPALQTVFIILLGLTFAVGVAAILTGLTVTRRQATNLVHAQREAAEAKGKTVALEVEAAKQREKAARAEKELAEFQRNVESRAKHAALRQALDALRGKPGGSAELLFQDHDPEAFSLSATLRSMLVAAGWTIPDEPRPLSRVYPRSGARPAFLSPGSVGSSGVVIVVKSRQPRERPPALDALEDTLRQLGTVTTPEDPALAPNLLRIIVGPKR